MMNVSVWPDGWIVPDWPAPANVRALMTTRVGGVSRAAYSGFNPASHVGDEPAAVAENRSRLRAGLPAEPFWLNQVHGTGVVEVVSGAGPEGGIPVEADASVARGAGRVCVVLTADCLPVLFCDRAGSVVAAAHAGWRGLADGVLEASVAAMAVAPDDILVWLGAAIGPDRFEVGAEVRAAFCEPQPRCAAAFRPAPAPGKWLADLYALARIRLATLGVTRVHGGGLCTHADPARFYSYRRDARTGRMASLVWLE